MTKVEAHQIIKRSLNGIRDRQLSEAVQIALKALAWECAHEKMLGFTVAETSEPKDNVNE